MPGLFKKYSQARFVLPVLVGAATFACYIPSLFNGFVFWDDQKYVYENPLITTIDFGFLKFIFSNFYFSNWQPLTLLSYAIDYSIWGLEPFGFHLTNTFFHSLNASLVFILTLSLIKNREKNGAYAEAGFKEYLAASAAALLFGLHPLHVESVAWVSERKDVLSAFFFLLSLLSHIRYAKDVNAKAWRYLCALIFFALALMSKSMAVSLPIVLLILDLYPLGRLKRLTDLKGVLVEKIPFFALSLATGVLAILAQGDFVVSKEAIPPDLRILNALHAYAFYLYKMAVPLWLSPIYPYLREMNHPGFEYVLSILVLIALTASCVFWRRYRILSAVFLYYVITLLPVSGILQVGVQAAADRYTYLPSIAPFILIGVGVGRVSDYLGKGGALAGVLGVCGVLAFLTVGQTGIWKNTLTLWDKAIATYPETAALAYYQRSVEYTKRGEPEKSLKDLSKAIDILPYYSIARYNRAILYKNSGRLNEALADLDIVIERRPTCEAYNNRGNIYKRLGNIRKAIEDYESAVSVQPDCSYVYYNLALLYSDTGDHRLALENAENAVRYGMEDARRLLESLRTREQ